MRPSIHRGRLLFLPSVVDAVGETVPPVVDPERDPLAVFNGPSGRTPTVLLFGSVTIALVAWMATLVLSPSMGMGPISEMVRSDGIPGVGFLLLVWAIMVDVMFPASAPMVQACRTLAFDQETRIRRFASLAAFLRSYIMVWTVVGLGALVLDIGVATAASRGGIDAKEDVVRVLGAAFLFAGIYQVTPLKEAGLRTCRSPLGTILA